MAIKDEFFFFTQRLKIFCFLLWTKTKLSIMNGSLALVEFTNWIGINKRKNIGFDGDIIIISIDFLHKYWY